MEIFTVYGMNSVKSFKESKLEIVTNSKPEDQLLTSNLNTNSSGSSQKKPSPPGVRIAVYRKDEQKSKNPITRHSYPSNKYINSH